MMGARTVKFGLTLPQINVPRFDNFAEFGQAQGCGYVKFVDIMALLCSGTTSWWS